MSRSEPVRLPAHLYVHVPLCRSKCAYCDFYSLPLSSATEGTTAVANSLAAQALAWLDRDVAPRPLRSVYIGGGTPSVLGADLARLVEVLTSSFPLEPDVEVTIEANPESLDRNLVEALARAGVTRVSLGAQSLDDTVLAFLERPHDAAAVRAAARAVHEAGLALSLDLICGIPGQTAQSWIDTVNGAINLGPEHVSVYPLSIEAGTPLAAAVAIGDVQEPDPDVAADMMLLAQHVLGQAGLERYEVANYARRGAESRHNTAYWTGMPYLGVGPGAHGMLDVETAAAVGFVSARTPGVARLRYAVACDLSAGLTPMPRVDTESLSRVEAAREDVMLGLRLVRGVHEEDIVAAGVASVIDGLAEDGLVELVDHRWRTTERGWLLGNEVFGAVWAGE
ncbi:MAG: coproporphyrinogen III oxidase [Actinobacteria bacterium HGW-Actinobacteria-1]|nr:MAG: coproporphyrinogen III oxidase [Actinobacteria bacterium HGW-Actinobacteria-1]